ncbi:MAG: DUF4175 family protein [Fodinibius sp.]|nr:DUF4175 family protein [Fodinibius sp.]
MDTNSQYSLIERFTTLTRDSFKTLLRKHKLALSVIFLATLFAGILVAGLLESVLFMPVWAKFTVAGLLLFAALGTLVYYYQKLNLPAFKKFYQQFGRTSGRTQLSDALDLYFSSDNKQYALQDAAIQQNLQKLDPEDLKTKLEQFTRSHQVHKHYRGGLSGAAGALALLLIFTGIYPSAMNRLAHLWVPYSPPNPYSYTIEPGTVTLEQGESFQPRINFDGDKPENLSLAFKTDIEEQFRQRSAINSSDEEVGFSPISMTTNGSYYFQMDGFRSQTYDVNVQLRPRLEQLSLNIIPPAYTRLDTTSYSYPFSKIQAYKGSKIELTGITNKPVSHFAISQNQSVDTLSTTATNGDSSVFKKQWTVTKTDTISFNMADSAGLSNKNKFRFVVDPRQDQQPFVSLLAPSDNIKMKTPEPLQLEYETSDDFGLTGASLHYELQRAFTDKPQQGSQSLPQPQINQTHQYTWEVPSLDPKPRDVLTFWIEVKDNNAYSGAQVGRSQKMTITFPSMTEYMDELENRESEVTQSLDSLSQSFDRMQQEYDQFKNQLKQDPQTNWQQKQQLDEVEQERQKVDKQVEELNKKFEEIRKEIEKSQSLSPETMESYQELQKLMKEINNPELQEALEKLRESLGQMNPDQMQKALENYEFNEEQYKQRIDRTMELFKSLKLNSDLEKVAKSLEEMAEQEKKISESEQSPAKEIEQQEAIKKDLDNVQEQVEKLGEQAPEKSKQKVDQLSRDAQQQMKQIKEELQKNIEQLKKQQQSGGQPTPGTKEQQKKIQQQMQQTAQQMRSAKQQLNQQRIQVNMGALKYVLYSLINLSTNQEELTKETENLPPRSQAFVDKARKERNISRQFTMLSDSLFEVSSEIPGFSNKINKKKAEVEGQLSQVREPPF